jgi:predicted RNA polymerase sigma factor
MVRNLSLAEDLAQDALVDQLAAVPSIQEYHLPPSVRSDLLAKLGRPAEARRELERAAALTGNDRERTLLLARAAECPAGSG